MPSSALTDHAIAILTAPINHPLNAFIKEIFPKRSLVDECRA